MDEADRKDLTYLVREIIDSEFEDSDWRQVEHALTLMEQSRGADDEDWTVGRNVLFNLLKENRTARGLRNTLPVRTDKPVPQPVRDRFVQLLHKVGHVPRQEQRVDDSA